MTGTILNVDGLVSELVFSSPSYSRPADPDATLQRSMVSFASLRCLYWLVRLFGLRRLAVQACYASFLPVDYEGYTQRQ